MAESAQSQEGLAAPSAIVVLSRMGERVAKLEANHESLKDDTGHIRSAIHEVNGELQKLVLLEHACQISLVNLTQDVGKIVAASPAVDRAISAFEGMRGDLRAVIEERHRREGTTSAMTRFIGGNGVLPYAVALAALSLWAWEHLAYRA